MNFEKFIENKELTDDLNELDEIVLRVKRITGQIDGLTGNLRTRSEDPDYWRFVVCRKLKAAAAISYLLSQTLDRCGDTAEAISFQLDFCTEEDQTSEDTAG